MPKWVTSGAVLLATAAALAECGAPTAAALKGRSTSTSDQASNAHVVTHHSSQTSGFVAETTLQREMKDNRIRTVTMLTANAGWAYSREHVWALSDAGTRWDPVWHHSVPILAFAAPSAIDAWVVTARTGARRSELWHTTNGGRTWVSSAVQTPTGKSLGGPSR